MRRKKRNYLPGFKSKVALATVKRNKTLVELAKQVWPASKPDLGTGDSSMLSA